MTEQDLRPERANWEVSVFAVMVISWCKGIATNLEEWPRSSQDAPGVSAGAKCQLSADLKSQLNAEVRCPS
jgi:hypothetical protein